MSLAELASNVGEKSPVDYPNTPPVDGQFRPNVPVADLIGNPRNPRDDIGDLSDLASIADRQLQPGTAVSRAAWIKLYPEDQTTIGTAKYVIVNGCRRLLACRKFGRAGMDIVVRDAIAATKSDLVSAAVLENIARRDFDVIEEAKAVQLLVAECGTADAAAERLGRTKGWVSQRRALLRLTPELQEALRAGDLAVRLARSLAQVPLENQVATWRAAQQTESDTESGEAGDGEADVESATKPVVEPQVPAPSTRILHSFRRVRADPAAIAVAVREHFDDREIEELIVALGLPR